MMTPIHPCPSCPIPPADTSDREPAAAEALGLLPHGGAPKPMVIQP